MTTEDEIRRVLHPEAHERPSAAKPMPFNPVRPVGPGQLPLGCDQQGRYPQAADLDELGVQPPDEPDWLERAEVLVVVIFFVVLIGAMVAALWGLA
jgi:hypothetical protein